MRLNLENAKMLIKFEMKRVEIIESKIESPYLVLVANLEDKGNFAKG